MRTDAVIDRQQVYCPNASALGFGKYKAQFGDIIVFREGDCRRVGRVAGRIKYAPPCGETPAIRGRILVIMLNDTLMGVSEHWVNPDDVLQIDPRANSCAELAAFFFSTDFKNHAPDALRAWSESGFSNMDQWYTYRANQKS